MLKTNSKKARANVKAYVMKNVDVSNYNLAEPKTFEEAAYVVLKEFRVTHWNSKEKYQYYGNEQVAWLNWCAGLPSILDTCYYYNRSAVDDLGAILEESEEEKKRFEEWEAEALLSKLMYWEILKGADAYEMKNHPIYLKNWNNAGYPNLSAVIKPLEKVVELYAPCTEPATIYKSTTKKAIIEMVVKCIEQGYTLKNNTSHSF